MPAVRARAPLSGAIPAGPATRMAAALALIGALVALPIPAAAASPEPTADLGSRPAAASPAPSPPSDATPTPPPVPIPATSAAAAPFDGITVTVEDSLFLADRSMLPVKVSNTHTYQIRVRVTVWANSGRLDIDGAPRVVTVAPQTQAAVEFPATAVSNGAVTVSAAIVDPDGQISIPTISQATFNVQAGWETPVLLLIAGLIGVLAIIGVIRTIRRVRRARQEPEHGPGPDDATKADG